MSSYKNFVCLLLVLIFCSCNNRAKKEMLWKAFCDFQTRELPLSLAHFDKLNDFDIVYQDENTFDKRYYYPNSYVVGYWNKNSNKYERIHCINGFSPVDNYEILKSASDFYSTDTTYLDNIIYTDTVWAGNKFTITDRPVFIATIYRKTNTSKRDKIIGVFMMWKRENINLKDNKLTFEMVERMNEHAFYN